MTEVRGAINNKTGLTLKTTLLLNINMFVATSSK